MCEAVQSVRVNILARRETRKVLKEGFPDITEDRCPHFDVVVVAYMPNEKDIIARQVRYFLRELDYPVSKLSVSL